MPVIPPACPDNLDALKDLIAQCEGLPPPFAVDPVANPTTAPPDILHPDPADDTEPTDPPAITEAPSPPPTVPSPPPTAPPATSQPPASPQPPPIQYYPTQGSPVPDPLTDPIPATSPANVSIVSFRISRWLF